MTCVTKNVGLHAFEVKQSEFKKIYLSQHAANKIRNSNIEIRNKVGNK